MASITQYRGKTWRAVVKRTGFPSASKTFELKRDAEKWAADIESKLGVSTYDRLQLKQAKVTTCQSIFERYLLEVVPDMPGRNEPNIIARLIRDAAFMRIRLDRIQPTDIRDWRDARVKQISPASVHRELNSISGVFTHAIKEWSAPLQANPAHLVSRFPNADKPRSFKYSDDDIAAFLKACKHNETKKPTTGRDYVGWAFLLALETAMREGELCLPTVADFNPEQKHIFLRKTKNGDTREVPLSVRAMQIVQHLCADKKPTDKIIAIGSDTLCQYAREARVIAKLTHLKFHDSRHTAATRLSTKLSNVLELSAVTGHRSLRALKRYYNPDPIDLANKLG